jgi:small subunit ribosomal protein S1
MSADTTPSVAIEPKQKFSGRVVKTMMAGALVDIGVGLPGVVHISQISKDAVNKVEDVLREGDTVDVWVRRVKNDRIELTMIEPLAYEWRELKPEMQIKGRVVRIEPYGAFVDFGAERPGMVHVSEMAHAYVRSPSEVLKEGDEVEAVILEVDRRKKQIRLSMKALVEPEPEPEVEAPKPERKRRPKSAKASKQEPEYQETVPAETEPTAFELAWQQALERSKQDRTAKPRPNKAASSVQQEIVARTLEGHEREHK